MKQQIYNQDPGPDGHAVALDLAAIKNILPHRHPMLMLDYAKLYPAARRVEAWKCVAADEPFFPGHFPGRPVMPGVLILEAMLQAGGLVLRHLVTPGADQPMVSAMRKVKFRRPVIPGDLLQLSARIQALRPAAMVLAAEAMVRGQLACQAEIAISLHSALPPPPAPVPLPEAAGDPLLPIEKILEIIPHRYPMLLVDSILKIEGDTLTAVKNVSGNEPFFQGHFPHRAVMPGSLLVESMAQAGAVYILQQPAHRGKLIYFMGVDRVRFRRPVQPGCQMLIHAQLCSLRTRAGRARGAIHVNGALAVDAEISFAIVDRG